MTRPCTADAGAAETSAADTPRIRFDRNELAGAFGDLGTDLPLVVGIILAAKLDATGALVMFGLMQALTGLVYRMPMPVQPLKAMAAIVITGKVGGPVLHGAGLAIGAAMLVLSVSGFIDLLGRIIPKSVIRGIQFGLGLQLSLLALKDYVRSDGAGGLLLAAAAFVIAVVLIGNRKYPAALFIVLLGFAYALVFKLDVHAAMRGAGFGLPAFHVPQLDDVCAGFVLLALPQLPLSIGNSIFATRQVAADLFPSRPIALRRIGITYALMNLACPFLGGIPVCHGSGGMAGHYAFGARTGGSVIIEGAFYVLVGLFLGRGFESVASIFPLPVLGVILLFEGAALMLLIRDLAGDRSGFLIAVLTGLAAAGLPYGYLVGMAAGIMLDILLKRGIVRQRS